MFRLAKLGVVEGLLAWIAYWSVESFLLHILPRFSTTSSQYMPPSAGFTALLLVIYAVTGCVMGALVGILVAIGASMIRDSEANVRTIVTMALCGLVAASVFPRLPPGLPAWFVGLIFVPVGLTLLLILFFAFAPGRLAVLASPWMVGTVLLGVPLLFDRVEATAAFVSSALRFLAFLTAAFLLDWLTARRSTPARRSLITGGVAVILLAACFLLRQEPYKNSRQISATPSRDKPNVIILTLDTVRADHMSLYGYERNTTPNLAKLAEKASVYTHAIAPGDMTLSSHASIFTGLYPSWHRAHFDRGYPSGRPLDSKYASLPEILSNKGFDSIGVVANFLFLGAGFGLDRGYGYYDSSAAVPFLGATRSFFVRQRIRNLLIQFVEPCDYERVFRRAEEINDAAVALLKQEKLLNRKFFLFLNYMDAHSPYLPPGPFARLYPGSDPHLQSGHYDGILKDVLTQKRHLPDHERRHFVAQYDGAIAYMDWSLGKLIQQLKQTGLYDNTLLIITADHGEAFGERGLMGHALSVYQHEVHIPLLIKYPKQTRKVVIDAPVSLVALMPTTLQVLGYDTPKNIQGRSLLQRMPEGADELISETFVHPLISIWNPSFERSAQSIISGSMKFIRSSDGARELYDLATDPNEIQNLFPTSRGAVLESKLVQFVKSAAVQERRPTPARASNQTVEKLKSLGYIQ